MNAVIIAKLALIELAWATCNCEGGEKDDLTHPDAHLDSCAYRKTLETIVSYANSKVTMDDFRELGQERKDDEREAVV